MKWEEEGYTRKDDHGNLISIVRSPIPPFPPPRYGILHVPRLTSHAGGI